MKCACKPQTGPGLGFGVVDPVVMTYHNGESEPYLVMIDACIAGTMDHLWMNGIDTVSCCCGHNQGAGPTVILKAGASEDDQAHVLNLIRVAGDTRGWTVLIGPERS